MLTTARNRAPSAWRSCSCSALPAWSSSLRSSPARSHCSPTRATWCRTGSRSGSPFSRPGWRGGRPLRSGRSAGGGRRSWQRSRMRFVLVALGLWIVVEALGRIGDAPSVEGDWVLAAGLAGLAVNVMALRVLHGAGSGLNIRAASRHVLADLASSVGVVVAALVILLTGWNVVDRYRGSLDRTARAGELGRDPARVDRDPARGRSRGPRHGRARADDARRFRPSSTFTTSTSGRSHPGFLRSPLTFSSSRGPTVTGSVATSSEC